MRGDAIHGQDLHRQPKHKERLRLRSDKCRLKNRIVREQVWECSKFVSQSGIEQRRVELQDSAEIEIINVFSITWYVDTNLTKVQISNEVSSKEIILVKDSNA